MVMEGGNVMNPAAQAPPATPAGGPDANRVAREFVRQYYTILHNSPVHLHRFYNDESEFIHGSIDAPSKSVRGQQEIHRAIMALNFRECCAKIHYVDAQESENKMVVVQVAGQLTNQGGPMRRFMQTFVLVQLAARKYYVRNDIFRYQDQVFEEEEEIDDMSAKVTQDEQNHEQPIFNGVAANDHVTLNGSGVGGGGNEHVATSESAATANSKDDNQWDNAMAAQFPSVQAAIPVLTVQASPNSNATASSNNNNTNTNNNNTSNNNNQETSTAAAVPRSWSQMVQVKKASDPAAPSATSQSSFGPPASSSFGGAVPAQGLSQKSQHGRGGGNKGNGMLSGLTPPKKDSPPATKEDDNSPTKVYVPDNQQLFVGNIPTNVSEKTLIDLFSKYGKVQDFRLSSAKTPTGPHNFKTNFPNFGFVIFDSSDTVQKVLEHARDESTTWEIDGKPVRLNIEEKKPRMLGGPKGGRGGLNNSQRGGGDRRSMPNGGRRDFNSRPPRSGPPRQNNASGSGGSGGGGGMNVPAQAQAMQH